MGPRPSATSQCYVCGREIGCHSLPFHEPRCLSRWRADAAALPPDKPRPATPARQEQRQEGDTVWTCLRCYNVLPASTRREEHAGSCVGPALLPKLPQRPKTRTLCRRATPPRPLTQTLLSRPGTQTLNRPTPNMDHPVIEVDDPQPPDNEDPIQQDVTDEFNAESAKEEKEEEERPPEFKATVRQASEVINSRTATIRPAVKVEGRPSEVVTAKTATVKGAGRGGGRTMTSIPPSACRSCQRSEAPERLHSHHHNQQQQRVRLRQRRAAANNAAAKIKGKVKNTETITRVNETVSEVNASDAVVNLDASDVEIDDRVVVVVESVNSNDCNSFEDVSVNDVNAILSIGRASSSARSAAPSDLGPGPDAVAEEEENEEEEEDAEKPERTSEAEGDEEKREEVNVPKEVEEEEEDASSSSSSAESGRKPRTVVCYLCGREFGSRSYPFHEPHCIERWRRENATLPSEQRRPLPLRPSSGASLSSSSQQVLNDSSSWETFTAQLVACPTCGRTFFPNRLPVHQRVCKGDSQVSVAPFAHKSIDGHDTPAARGEPRKSAVRRRPVVGGGTVYSPSRTSGTSAPVGVACYVCGRQFGSISLPVHEPQCLEKWRMANALLPTDLQRTEPLKPQPVLAEDGSVDAVATEEAAWRSHLEQLSPCGRCGRTFFPDRLLLHQKSCKAQPLQQEGGQKQQRPLPCP